MSGAFTWETEISLRSPQYIQKYILIKGVPSKLIRIYLLDGMVDNNVILMHSLQWKDSQCN